ncbi:hypothetical protein ACF12Z_001514 [Clostridioides difficile]
MRIYKSFFRFEKCRKACKYRLYRLMRTYKEIVKNYILISNKYEGKVYITLDNHSILINNQCIFSIKSKQSQKFNYKIIEKIEVVKNILNIYTNESNYKIRLRALSLEDEKKLLNIIDEKMKKFKA